MFRFICYITSDINMGDARGVQGSAFAPLGFFKKIEWYYIINKNY